MTVLAGDGGFAVVAYDLQLQPHYFPLLDFSTTDDHVVFCSTALAC